MTFLQRIFWAQLVIAVAALSIGYAVAGKILVSLLVVLLGSAWVTAQQRKRAGQEGFLLAIYLIAAAAGLVIGVPAWLSLIAVVATLGAWDLDHFLRRLSLVERVEFDTGLGREHLRRLGIVQGAGLLGGLIAMAFRARIPFWWEALLVLLAIIGIRQVILFVRKQMEE